MSILIKNDFIHILLKERVYVQLKILFGYLV